MKFYQRMTILFCFIISVFGCNQVQEQEAEKTSSADSTTRYSVSSLAAVENNKDTLHKFIRTADLKFKVKDVIKSTYNIEEVTNREGVS